MQRNLTSDEVNQLRTAIREHDEAHERLNELVRLLGGPMQQLAPNQEMWRKSGQQYEATAPVKTDGTIGGLR